MTNQEEKQLYNYSLQIQQPFNLHPNLKTQSAMRVLNQDLKQVTMVNPLMNSPCAP